VSQDAGVDHDATQLAEAYFEVGKYEGARDVLSRALSQHPNDPDLLAQYARAEYLLKNFAAAAHSAYAALSVAPQSELAMRAYALSLEGLGRLPEALSMAWHTVVAHPNSPVTHKLYARLLLRARQGRAALCEVDEALRLDPTNVDALVLRGSILQCMDRIDESDAAFGQALTLEPGNADALHDMSLNRLRHRKYARALRGFLGAAGIDPKLGDLARKNIGLVLAKILKIVTPVAVLLSGLAIFVGSVDCSGHSTVPLRVATGLVTATLIAVLGWMYRSVPRPVLVSVLRDRVFVTARVLHAVLALALGAGVTLAGGPEWTIPAGVFLVFAGLILARVGLRIIW
jgi:tetratricopeptide (TPR) repeat protein